MIVLSIETTAGICSCALLENDKILMEIHEKTDSQQQRLMPAISDLYFQTGINKKNTGLVTVDIGPGAFTALRIGVTTAKTFAHALDIPIKGVSALEALYIKSQGFKNNCDRIMLIDARRNKCFTGIYRLNGEVIDNLDLLIEDVLYYTNEKTCTVFSGSGALLNQEKILFHNQNGNFTVLNEDYSELKAGEIGKMGYLKFMQEGGDNKYKIVPLYVRDTDNVTKGR